MSELVLGEMYRALTMADFHTPRIGKRKMSVARFNLVAEETAKAVARTGRVQLYFSPFCLHRCHSVVHLVWIGQAHILAHELEFLKGLVVQPHPFHSDKMERKSKAGTRDGGEDLLFSCVWQPLVTIKTSYERRHDLREKACHTAIVKLGNTWLLLCSRLVIVEAEHL